MSKIKFTELSQKNTELEILNVEETTDITGGAINTINQGNNVSGVGLGVGAKYGSVAAVDIDLNQTNLASISNFEAYYTPSYYYSAYYFGGKKY